MPNEIHCLLEGEIYLHSVISEPNRIKQGFSTIRTDPGSRVSKQQLNGTLGTFCGSLVGSL